jgi:hypothetical protein
MVVHAQVINGAGKPPVSVSVDTYSKLIENDVVVNQSITTGPVAIVVEIHGCTLGRQREMYPVCCDRAECKLISGIGVNPAISRISTIYINLETVAVGEETRECTTEVGLSQGIGLDPKGDTESRKSLCLAQIVDNEVVNAVEMQRSGTVVPSYPLRFAGECTISNIAGCVDNGSAGISLNLL